MAATKFSPPFHWPADTSLFQRTWAAHDHAELPLPFLTFHLYHCLGQTRCCYTHAVAGSLSSTFSAIWSTSLVTYTTLALLSYSRLHSFHLPTAFSSTTAKKYRCTRRHIYHLHSSPPTRHVPRCDTVRLRISVTPLANLPTPPPYFSLRVRPSLFITLHYQHLTTTRHRQDADDIPYLDEYKRVTFTPGQTSPRVCMRFAATRARFGQRR